MESVQGQIPTQTFTKGVAKFRYFAEGVLILENPDLGAKVRGGNSEKLHEFEITKKRGLHLHPWHLPVYEPWA